MKKGKTIFFLNVNIDKLPKMFYSVVKKDFIFACLQKLLETVIHGIFVCRFLHEYFKSFTSVFLYVLHVELAM